MYNVIIIILKLVYVLYIRTKYKRRTRPQKEYYKNKNKKFAQLLRDRLRSDRNLHGSTTYYNTYSPRYDRNDFGRQLEAKTRETIEYLMGLLSKRFGSFYYSFLTKNYIRNAYTVKTKNYG